MTSTSSSISEIPYANQVLVDTQWLQDHKFDDFVRVAEVDYDPSANYELGHIPGSVIIFRKRILFKNWMKIGFNPYEGIGIAFTSRVLACAIVTESILLDRQLPSLIL